MKIKSLLILVVCCLMVELCSSQTRHALIVAIGNYPDPKTNGWPVINSENDIPLIKNALLNQRFAEKNIQVLKDSAATRKGIVDALDKLIANVAKGDIVVIHFSSHGEQIEDDDKDEMDGLDEVIVPYGAVYSKDPDKFTQFAPGYIRDDLFGDKVTQLRNKLGKAGDLLVDIDACHSGSATRGVTTAKVRGGNSAMVSKNFNANKFTGQDTGVFKDDNKGTKLNADAASYVVISAAQAKELNDECYDDNGNAAGSLSYSFSKAISSLKGNITYRGLFAMIENVMRDKVPNQKPVLEGDGVDRELFGGRYEQQQMYFSIDKTLSKNGMLALNGGFVSGLTKGSEINFFAPGTTSTAGKKPVGTGKVISVSSYTAMVKPDSAGDKLLSINPWAFVSEMSYGGEKLKISVRDIKPVAKTVQDSLKGFQLVEFNPTCDLFLDTSGSINNWALKYPNNGIVFQEGFNFSGKENVTALKAALRRYSRFRYLKGLTFNETGLAAKVELVFLDANKNADEAKMKSRTAFGRLELKEDDNLTLRIINSGNRNFFINIVDIQPDGIINPVLPNKNATDKNNNPAPIKPEDCQVRIADTAYFAISIAKPYGEETFKVFLSASELDLESILTSKDDGAVPVGKRGFLSGLEKIFAGSTVSEIGTRGAIATKINTEQNGTVFSLNFRIIP